MGIIKDFRNFRKSMKVEKGINFVDGFGIPIGIEDSNGNWLYQYKDNNVVSENIFNTIAGQLSLAQVRHLKKDGKKVKVFDIKESAVVRMSKWQANEKQTFSDFLHTFFYNTVKFGNGLAYIDPYFDGKGKNDLKLVNINVENCEFGHIYEEENDTMFLVVREKNSSEIKLLNYKMILHLRYKPQKIHQNESYIGEMINEFSPVYSNALKLKLREMINENGDKVIYKMRMMGQVQERDKLAKQKVMQGTFTNSKVIAIDSDEDISKLELKKFAYDKTAIDDIKELIFNSYGVNSNVMNGDYTEQQFNSFYNNTLEPILVRFQEELNRKLLSYYDFMNYESIEINRTKIATTITEFAKSLDKLVYHGVVNVNESREFFGLEPIENGDKYHTNLNAVELSSALKGGENGKEQKN